MTAESVDPESVRRHEREIGELRGSSRDQRQSLDLILQELGGIRWEQRQHAAKLEKHGHELAEIRQRVEGMDQRMTTGFTEIREMLAEVVNRLDGQGRQLAEVMHRLDGG
jgi:septal ring factor EnvC (AmiA/AmiB activator)